MNTSEISIEQALQAVAVAKYIIDDTRARQNVAKAFLEATMTPGDRRIVSTSDGMEVATVSLVRGREATAQTVYEVSDPAAYYEWARENGVDVGTPTLLLPEWATTSEQIERVVSSHGGELPPGVTAGEVMTGGKKPYLQVRMTEAQKAVIDNVRGMELTQALRHIEPAVEDME